MKIKDIANLSGVSPSTVSRVINDSGYVKTEVRERVQQIIKETGYKPNEVAKSLKTKRTHIIGVILPIISSQSVSRMVLGITEVANNENYQLLLANTYRNVKEELKYLKIFKSKQVDGIIMMATEITSEHKEIADSMGMPVVFVGQKVKGHTSIIHNDYDASRDIVELLVKYGHRSIAFIGVYETDEAVGVLRKKAYLDVMRENSFNIPESYISIKGFNAEDGYNCMAEILDRSETMPTAVFAVTDTLARGAIELLNERGISVPNDISIVGIGGKNSNMFSPRITGVQYHHKTAGKIACELLLNSIEYKEEPKSITVLDYEIVKGNSIKDIRNIE